MSFRREYNKINRGRRCRCSTGESWALGVLFCRCAGGLGAIALFGVWEIYLSRFERRLCKKKKERRRNAAASIRGAGNSILLSPWQSHKNPHPSPPPKTHTPIKTNPSPPPLFLQMVSPPRHQKNDGRTLPGFGPVHLARRTHRFLRLV